MNWINFNLDKNGMDQNNPLFHLKFIYKILFIHDSFDNCPFINNFFMD